MEVPSGCKMRTQQLLQNASECTGSKRVPFRRPSAADVENAYGALC